MGPTFFIEYRDRNGEPSLRQITVRAISVETEAPMLHAYCHERDDERNFRIDRIQSVIDLNGEYVSDSRAFLHAIIYACTAPD